MTYFLKYEIIWPNFGAEPYEFVNRHCNVNIHYFCSSSHSFQNKNMKTYQIRLDYIIHRVMSPNLVG